MICRKRLIIQLTPPQSFSAVEWNKKKYVKVNQTTSFSFVSVETIYFSQFLYLHQKHVRCAKGSDWFMDFCLQKAPDDSEKNIFSVLTSLPLLTLWEVSFWRLFLWSSDWRRLSVSRQTELQGLLLDSLIFIFFSLNGFMDLFETVTGSPHVSR